MGTQRPGGRSDVGHMHVLTCSRPFLLHILMQHERIKIVHFSILYERACKVGLGIGIAKIFFCSFEYRICGGIAKIRVKDLPGDCKH